MIFNRGEVSLHAMLTSAGCEACGDRDYDWHGLKRGPSPFALVQHTLAGNGRMRFEDRHFDIAPGDTMLLQFPHDNRYWLPPGAQWTFFWICVNGREALRIFLHLIERHGPVVRLSNETIERLAGQCLDVIDGRCDSAGKASATAYATVMTLGDELMLMPTRRHRQRHPAIQRVVDHVRGSLDANISVERLAETAGFTRHHFSRVFKDSEGLSPIDFVQRERMNKAVRLLQVGNASVKTVARACGFTDPNYFAKAFRRTFGVSPSEFQSSGLRRGD